jgi:phage-related protein
MNNQEDKDIAWVGSSKEDLCAFPEDMREAAGKQLRRVQRGLDPENWKSFDVVVGPGTKEIRLQDADGWYRVMYVAKFADAVYVLHSFQKKTNATFKEDIALAEARYKAVLQHQAKLKQQAKQQAKAPAAKAAKRGKK